MGGARTRAWLLRPWLLRTLGQGYEETDDDEGSEKSHKREKLHHRGHYIELGDVKHRLYIEAATEIGQ